MYASYPEPWHFCINQADKGAQMIPALALQVSLGRIPLQVHSSRVEARGKGLQEVELFVLESCSENHLQVNQACHVVSATLVLRRVFTWQDLCT